MKCVIFLMLMVLGIALHTNAQEIVQMNQGAIVNDNVDVVKRYRSERGLVILKLRIGKKRYRFLLDTGAPTVVSSRLQSRLRFEQLGTARVFDAFGRSDSAAVVRVRGMAIDALQLEGVPALVWDSNNPVFEVLGVDGILGSNALRDLAITISSRSKTVHFSNQQLPIAAGYQSPMRTDLDGQSTPAIPVRFGDRAPELVLFDSGFEGLCDLSQATSKSVTTSYGVVVRVVRDGAGFFGLNGDAPASSGILLQKVQLGGYMMSSVAASVSGDSRSKIGAELLERGEVTLDYKRGVFGFRPYTPAP